MDLLIVLLLPVGFVVRVVLEVRKSEAASNGARKIEESEDEDDGALFVLGQEWKSD